MNALNEFENLCQTTPGIHKLGNYAYEFRLPTEAKTLTLIALVHGNEIGNLDIFNTLLTKIKTNTLQPKVHLRLILGNVPAYLQNKRFIESDLNRSFSLTVAKTSEEKRAKEIEALLQGSDAVIDFHQTLEPCLTPFFILSYNPTNLNFSRSLNSAIPAITFKSFSNVSAGKGLSSTASDLGIPAITLETGEKGSHPEQLNFGIDLIIKAINLIADQQISHAEKINLENVYTWGDTIVNPEFKLELVRRFKNFEEIKKGESLAKSSETTLNSPSSGPILFPKYDQYRLQSPELVRILKPLTSIDELK